jgi:hypothetical protein
MSTISSSGDGFTALPSFHRSFGRIELARPRSQPRTRIAAKSIHRAAQGCFTGDAKSPKETLGADVVVVASGVPFGAQPDAILSRVKGAGSNLAWRRADGSTC